MSDSVRTNQTLKLGNLCVMWHWCLGTDCYLHPLVSSPLLLCGCFLFSLCCRSAVDTFNCQLRPFTSPKAPFFLHQPWAKEKAFAWLAYLATVCFASLLLIPISLFRPLLLRDRNRVFLFCYRFRVQVWEDFWCFKAPKDGLIICRHGFKCICQWLWSSETGRWVTTVLHSYWWWINSENKGMEAEAQCLDPKKKLPAAISKLHHTKAWLHW